METDVRQTLEQLVASIAPLLEEIRVQGMTPVLVGGCVRDAFLGVESKDIDIEVHGAVSMEHLTTVLRSAKFVVDEVGRAFGVLKVKCRGQVVDVSLPRRDSKLGAGHTGFTVEVDAGLSFKEAAARRDFTINSVMFDPFTDEFIDPYDGIGDLHKGILSATSSAFAEDPLRVLRAVQFVARFGFRLDGPTIGMCRDLQSEFRTISVERIWTEFEKIASKGVFFPEAFDVLRVVGWSQFFPEVHFYTGCSAGVVAQKCRERGFSVERRSTLVMASIAMQTDDPIKFLRSISAPVAIEKLVTAIDGVHLVSHPSWAECRLVARKLAPFTIETLAILRGSEAMAEIAEKAGVLHGPLKPFVTGMDLLEMGLTAGPVFKTILEDVTFEQDSGHLTSRSEAIAYIVSKLAQW